MSRKILDSCLFSVNKVFNTKSRLAPETRYSYLKSIGNIVRELHTTKYQISNINHFKRKHADFLIKNWQESGISNATIKNRLSHLRYLSELINKPGLLPKTNDELNVEKRSYISAKNKAVYEVDISKFGDPLIRYSIQLQQQFGLRRKEAIKFIVSDADEGKYIRLKSTWTKGGIERTIPVITLEQKALLNELKSNIPQGKSLIPDNKPFSYQKRVYDEAVIKAGYRNLHGLRHAYAQRRYFDITNERTDGKGWQAPFNGGRHIKDLSDYERKIDDEARLIISRELGHARKEISAIYLGS